MEAEAAGCCLGRADDGGDEVVVGQLRDLLLWMVGGRLKGWHGGQMSHVRHMTAMWTWAQRGRYGVCVGCAVEPEGGRWNSYPVIGQPTVRHVKTSIILG